MRRLPLPFLIAGLMLLVGCRKDRPEPPADGPIVVGAGGVYVVNEGNLGWDNGGVGHYDPATGHTVEDLYAPANGEGLGDVVQSLVWHNGRGFVVVNNAGKVVVVDPTTFTAIATITGFPSPRHLLPVGPAKAYVSDLQSNALRVVDLSTYTITGSIPCPGWTEEMVLAYGKVFVTSRTRSYVYVIDSATDQLVDSIAVSLGGNSIVADAQGRLWVACTGGGGTQPALYRIHPVSRTVEAVLPVNGGVVTPWRLATNGDHTRIYFLDRHVYRLSPTDEAMPTTPFIAADGRNLYALGVDPVDGAVYVADALDYTQRGVVFRYTSAGQASGEFLAGRVPGRFAFR